MSSNHEQINSHPERISSIKSLIDQYNWKEIDLSSRSKDWKKFESNKKPIVLNILHAPHNTEKMRHAYKSKYNLKRENQVIFLVITDGEKWHYLAVKSLSALLRGITGNNNGYFYCFIVFAHILQKIGLKSIKTYAKTMIIAMWRFQKKIIIY